MLVSGEEYDYITRTSMNQGILKTTGFVNKENINPAGVWSLGLLQMDFFYRKKPWYAGQFVRKIIPKIEIHDEAILFFTTLLNKQKKRLLSVLVRNVDETFKQSIIKLPTKNGEIDFKFINSYIAELEALRIAELEAYLLATGLKDYNLTLPEKQAIENFAEIKNSFTEIVFSDIFNNIKQGRRLKKEDQIPGNTPFVMSGITNTGVVNYVSNSITVFPANSITVDIFGNTFYRDYEYGAGDDTGVYWNDTKEYSKETMLFFATAMGKSLQGKFSYGKKLRSSQSFDFKINVPTKNNVPDYEYMETLISAIQKLVIKDVVLYADKKISATKSVISNKN